MKTKEEILSTKEPRTDDLSLFIEANSWGLDWGDKGLFYTPISQLQGDINEFGAIALTHIPYTPKQVKVNQLQEQIKLLQNMIKGVMARETFYNSALGFYRSGEIMHPEDIKLGCGFAMDKVWNKAFPNDKVVLGGTGPWWDWMKKSPKFQELLDYESDCIIVSPTNSIPMQSKLTNGHIGLIGRKKAPDGSYWILSNNSTTGKLDVHWTVKSWNDYYHKYGKIPTYYFKIVS